MRKPRFSITSLLASMALLGAVLALALSRYEIAQVRQRYDHVLQETGYIEVRDPSKVYVRKLDCPAPLTWRYQIYMPPAHELQWGLGVELNERGWPSRLLDSGHFSRQGQSTLTVSLHHRKGAWRLSRFFDNGGSDYRLIANDFEWLQVAEHENGYSGRTGYPPHEPIREYDPDQPFLLLSLQSEQQSSPTDGSLLIWLEPDLRSHYRKPTPDDPLSERDSQRKAAWQTYLIRK